MATVLTQVVLKALSGMPEDDCVNTFAFLTPAPGIETVDLIAIETDLMAFYNNIPSGMNAVAGWINNSVDRAASKCEMKHYDLAGHLDGTPHGSPVREILWTLGPQVSGGSPLPRELAVCLSFHADFATDVEFGAGTRPRARDRGRVFIGPLVFTAIEQANPTGKATVAQGVRDSLTSAATALKNATGQAWGVWSRRNAVIEPVVGGWVDDAFDVQRRRGADPTVRQSF